MAKPLTSWLVPSFSQHNLHLVVLGRYLHVSETKYQDKFAIILRQVKSPNNWDKFQICCTDMYVFDKISTEFRGISRVFVNFAAPLLLDALAMSCVIYILQTGD